MNTDNITKKEFKAFDFSNGGFTSVWIEFDGVKIASFESNPNIFERAKKVSSLCVESLNIKSETGLSPIQMKERIADLESKTITDNSQVNTNILKENEALKERIKELEKQANKLIQWESDYPPQRIYGMSQTITIAKEMEEIILSFKNALNPKK